VTGDLIINVISDLAFGLVKYLLHDGGTRRAICCTVGRETGRTQRIRLKFLSLLGPWLS